MRPGNGNEYEPATIEDYWQKRWQAEGLYRSEIDPSRPKHYALTMLPYPSGDLHIGHWYAIAPADALARHKRMTGHNVLFPMGFDSFGLPAENAAIQRGVHPRRWTYSNIDRMRRQLERMGAMFDWEREAITSDPAYYRWSQWFFLQLLDHDLAYRKKAPVDWCPGCNTTLAREQVHGDDRRCERCRTPVVKRELDQWFFRTTRYAEELLGFSGIDWPERVRRLQTNWIGRSEGASVAFRTESGDTLEVFTTRPDTLWGVTFLVLAPEHPSVPGLTSEEQRGEVAAYVESATRQSEIQREAADRDKSGVFTGGYAVNPVNGERVPVWVADYVLMSYGSGAVMAVPAHDQRDFEFARRYGLEVRPVIRSTDGELPDGASMEEAVPAKGVVADSGPLTGTPGEESVTRAISILEESGAGSRGVSYRLRDWLISRQRYWGAPIPVVHCPGCGVVPVPDEELPVLLPEDVEWMPTGESPLKLHPTWKRTRCGSCGGEAERESDTMDTFMCSSWYHLRYLSPRYDRGPFDPAEYAYWMPVDTYTGGIEHATMHLIYTRFFHKACRDMGIVDGDEPMTRFRYQGTVLGEDSEKMSKSRGNVVAPDELIERYGVDSVRAFLMFFARWEQGGPWNERGIEGTSRWLNRVWSVLLQATPAPAGAVTPPALRRKLHQTIERVTRGFERLEFNTIVAALMELLNQMAGFDAESDEGAAEAWREARDVYLRLLAPVTPHIAEELWHRLGGEGSVHLQRWPETDEVALAEEETTLIVQIDGKVRDRLTVPVGLSETESRRRALASEGARRFLGRREAKRVIVVPDRLVNIVGG